MKNTTSRIGIEKAEFFAYHGYYEEERKSGNIFLVNAWVEKRMEDTGSHQVALDQTFNYELIFHICATEMRRTQHLLETVALNILDGFEKSFPDATGMYIRIDKLGPQLGGKVGSSFVEFSK